MFPKGRHLPHVYAIGEPLFVTFRLHGSLPQQRAFPPNLTSGEQFVAMDRLLDNARSGPMFLRQPEIAEEVRAVIEFGAATGNYDMHAWVIMPNHVHLLFTPKVDVSKVLRSLKGVSARNANLLLGRTGQPFWQNESYDHLVRNSEEFRRIQRYIENNPVKAGLVQSADEYAWSSIGRAESPAQAKGPPYKNG